MATSTPASGWPTVPNSFDPGIASAHDGRSFGQAIPRKHLDADRPEELEGFLLHRRRPADDVAELPPQLIQDCFHDLAANIDSQAVKQSRKPDPKVELAKLTPFFGLREYPPVNGVKDGGNDDHQMHLEFFKVLGNVAQPIEEMNGSPN